MRFESSIQFNSFFGKGLRVSWVVLFVFGIGMVPWAGNLCAGSSEAVNSTGVQVVSGPVQVGVQGKLDKVKSTNDTLTWKSTVPPGKELSKDSEPPPMRDIRQPSPMAVPGASNRAAELKGVRAHLSSGAVIRLLETQRVSVDFQEVPFRDVIKGLRRQLGINVVVYWPSVRQSGIDDEDPVTLKLDQVPADKVIDAVLAYVSSYSAEKLAWNVDKGVLEIDIAGNLKEPYVVRGYYIADLAAPRNPMMGMGMGMGNMGMGMGMGNTNAGGSNFGYSGYNQRSNRFNNNRGRRNRRTNRGPMLMTR